jgi:hypothetical protein
MKNKSVKPTPEAKALSLFLMAHKSINPAYKEKAKRINKQWDLVGLHKLSMEDYQKEVQEMLIGYGGYEEVLEKTVRYYIKKTGQWTLKGGDKYCQDAQKVADRIIESNRVN